jgi:hypothetical protein
MGQLVDLSLSAGWAQPAFEVIRAARHDIDSVRFAEVIFEFLPGAEVEDYLGLADILVRLEEWEALREVVRSAAENSDPIIREVALDFTRRYGGSIS